MEEGVLLRFPNGFFRKMKSAKKARPQKM